MVGMPGAPGAPNVPAQPNGFFAKVLADQQYERGRELEGQGYWEQALLCYRRACGLDRTGTLFLLARGRVCQEHGLEPEAAECYEAVLRLQPNDVVALYNQAQLLAARGDLDAARANLTRILNGDVELLGERAAPVFCRLGDLALRQEQYAAAGAYFRRALDVAPGHAYAAASAGALARLAEFERPVAPDGRIAPKVALYAYAGAVLLGMPGDDGIDIPFSPGLGFDSLEEVAQTLARLVALARRQRWQVDAVAALDPDGQPLAVALAQRLRARVAFTPDTAPRGAAALAVSASGAEPARLASQIEALRERASRTIFYAAGLRHAVWDYRPAPHVVSMPVRLEFPWNRGEVSAPEHAEAYGAELAALLARAPDDGTLAAQLAWYERHSRLVLEDGAPAVS
jgi:tetratricopeptide (TPR) repeat protein